MVEVDFYTLPDFAQHINDNPDLYDDELKHTADEFSTYHKEFVERAEYFQQAMEEANLTLKPQRVYVG